MDNFRDQIKETKDVADSLTLTVSNLYKKIADLNQQQADMAKAGNTNNKYYETLIGILDKYQGKLSATTETLTNMNVKMYDQIRVLTSSRERIEIFGKAWDNTTAIIEASSKNAEHMGKILGESANGFKTFTGNLKNAHEIITPFKDGIAKANQAYTEYAQNVASGKGKFESFKEAISSLTKGIDAGSGGFKNFKIALAETGIGIIIIAVAALIEKLQTMKPVMEFINGITASIGAVMNTLGNSIVGLFTNPIDTIKNFGSSMAGAAKDAYNLSIAQDKLKTVLSSQEVANEKIKNQVNLLKEQAENTKLTTDVRRAKLQEAHALDEKYFKQNGNLANMAMDQAVKAAKIKGTLHNDEVANLRSKGTEYARTLLETHRIDQEQFDAIKKADLELIKMRKEHADTYKAFLESNQKLKDEDKTKSDAQKAAAEQKATEMADKKLAAREAKKAEYKKNREEAEKERKQSIERMAEAFLGGYAKEIEDVNKHFNELKKKYADNKATVTQIEKERVATLSQINDKFRNDDLQKLDGFAQELKKLSRDAGKTAQELAIQQLKDEYAAKTQEIDRMAKQAQDEQKNIQARINELKKQGRITEAGDLQAALAAEINIISKANIVKQQLEVKYKEDNARLTESAEKEKAVKLVEKDKGKLKNNIEDAHDKGDWKTEFEQKQSLLNLEKQQAIDAAIARNEGIDSVDRKYKQKQKLLDKAKLDAQAESQKKYLKTTESLSNAVMSIFGKNTIASRIAFKAHQAAAAAQVIIDTKRSIMGIWASDAGMPLIGVPKAIAETAIVAAVGASSLASIIKQKPGFEKGGHYTSDGRGALLPGYSRTDNTNAYLRSGEAVVVSEAMRNPWARNLVSAINVAHGGRDFSVPNTSRGYAIGGIYTDGGNANRYYSQPVNDIKDMANTLAYQMINNFPPIYVDVKDVNNQQNILAQTVNRVNL